MFVRIARFEGGERDWDDFAGQLREAAGNRFQGSPLEGVVDLVQRIALLVDRENNRGANAIVCATEEDARRVDAAMNAITPASGRGARTSVEIYELLLDHAPNS